MLAKIKEHNKAVLFRKAGLSYSEIKSQVPVSQSTLSVWLKGISLTKEQKQMLLEKKRGGN